MALRNSRNNRPSARSARASQVGRVVPQNDVEQPFRSRGVQQEGSSAYRASYTSGAQGRSMSDAYSRQPATSQYSRNNPQYSRNANRRMSRGKKITIGVLAAVLVAVVGCGTAFALYVNSLNNELMGDITSEEMQAIQDVLAPRKSFDEPFYMMLVGSDERTGNDEMGARSDTNIVVYVDTPRNQASIVSIPRDTMIEVDGVGITKFNAAYNYGGLASTISESSELLGVDISHYAQVNFEHLVQLVDAVGGVDVEVTERIDDPDADNTSGDPSAEHIIIEEGMQHLNGEQALVFARSRAFADGDFTRTANQRKIIMALVNKVLDMPVHELPGVIQGAAKCVTTDLSVTDIISLAEQFKDRGDLTVYSAMAPTVFMNQLVNGQSFVLNDPDNTQLMIQTIEEGEDPSPIVGVCGKGPGGHRSGSCASGGSGGGSANTNASTHTGAGGSGYYNEEPPDEYDPYFSGASTQGR